MDPVTICNMALGLIGQNRIASLNDKSVAAELCKTFFIPSVKKAISEKAWLFATGPNLIDFGNPTPMDHPDPDLPVAFKVPAEVATIYKCADAGGDFTIIWERRDEYVVAEAGVTKLFAVATRYVADPDRWTPTFCWAVAYLLTSILVGPLTEGSSTKWEKKYEDELHKAGVIDGIQGTLVPKFVVRHSHSPMGRR